MTKAELKEKHPELYAAIEADAKAGMVDQSQLAALETENAQLKNDQRDLITANIDMSETLAKNIFDASFSGSTLPKSLKPKFAKLVDHKDFVAANGVLDAKAYKQAVDTEIAEWATAASFEDKNKEEKILGLPVDSKADATGLVPEEDTVDDTAARMLKHLN